MSEGGRGWRSIPLWQRVVGGLAVGILTGLFAPEVAEWFAPVGEIFVRLIRMLVVPIVFVSIASGVTALADPRRLGSVGSRILLLFAFTTVCAVAVGMAMGLLIEPGVGAITGATAGKSLGPARSIHDQLVGIVPVNIVQALAEGDMLAIIFFSVMLGFGIIMAGKDGEPLTKLLNAAGAALFHLVRLVMELTPFGVAALTARAVAENGMSVFTNIGWLAMGVALGVAMQMALVHLPMVVFMAKMRARRFFRSILDALLVAFSTASSAATLPVALRIAIEDLHIDPPIASTVLPIGASIGKDGTAMYVGLLSIFSLQALGIVPDIGMLALILLTGSLAAFGTAPIPSASLFMLAAVLSAVGVAAEQTAMIVGFILPFDRLLDMTRTVASASANLTVTSTVARQEGAIDD